MGRNHTKKSKASEHVDSVISQSDGISELTAGISYLGLKSERAARVIDGEDEFDRKANIIFAQNFGNDMTRLAGWQTICWAVGEYPADSIKQCKKVLKGVHVALFDLVNALRLSVVVPQNRLFHNRHQLSNYLQSNRKKMFPKKIAKQNVFIKEMLEFIF